ncbi:AMP-binding protein, partial [Streptomyces sp. NPDC056295]|uniref:AMP-binding protein n=1 Tax=Streptomyces sp. NPDC056295 TaxID=3345774 RepID=UPI0035D806D3
MNLSDSLHSSAVRHGSNIAVELGDQSLTYSALDVLAGRTAALLTARGVRPGDRVGIMLPNLPEFPVLFYGALRAGAVVVPMNPLLKAREIAHYLSDSGAVLLFVHESLAEEVDAGRSAAGSRAAVVPVATGSLTGLLAGHPEPVTTPVGADEDTAVILYTSGTTGLPKGAELTHTNLGRNPGQGRIDRHADRGRRDAADGRGRRHRRT